MKKIFSIISVVFLLVSCENDVQTNTPAFQGEKDNLFWRANDSRVIKNTNNTITINAYSDKELVTVTVPNTKGTYSLGTSNQNISASYSFQEAGIYLFHETALVEGPVNKLTGISNGGTGYEALNGNNLSTTTTGTGSGLTVKVTTNTSGAVTAVSIASRGIGYKAGDLVTIVGGNNNAKVAILNTLKSNGTVEVEKIEGNLYTGTFSFNAVDEHGNVVNFNKGVFYQVPLY